VQLEIYPQLDIQIKKGETVKSLLSIVPLTMFNLKAAKELCQSVLFSRVISAQSYTCEYILLSITAYLVIENRQYFGT
jgi:hypothetical protein